jgi:hypothetical protein
LLDINHLFICERHVFDIVEKSSNSLLEIHIVVSSENKMGSDTRVLESRSLIYIYKENQRP